MRTMELRWIKTRPKIPTKLSQSETQRPSSIPIYISTRPSHINAGDLRRLYADCGFSGHRFSGGDPIDGDKLRIALSHSAFVASVFGKPVSDGDGPWRSVVDPVSPLSGELVGFGRAVSDLGLTASIYDVMVVPSLRGLGIGRLIVQRIIRMLTSRDIYDIAALCSEDERSFFQACGFRDDILGSTTMMYTRSVSSEATNQMATSAGRKLLLIPPLKTPQRVQNP